MSDLVKVENFNGELVVSSRAVAENFEKQHKHVLETINQLSGQLNTAEKSALFIESEYKASNGKMNKEYLLTRDGFTLVAMGFTGSKALQWKLKYIEAFNKMEEELRNPSKTLEQALTSPDFLIKLATNLKEEQEKRKLFENENLLLTQTVADYKPKVEYFDKILSCDNALLPTTIAFDYGMSAQELNKILCDEGIQRKVRSQWILYKDYMGKGYTKSETIMIGDKPRIQTLWTQKGRLLIHEVLNKRQIKALMDM